MSESLIDAASKVWKATGIMLTVICGIGLVGIFISLVLITIRAW